MRFNDVKSHLKKFKVGIAGAGGLGSNCAASLARSGVGSLVISDFDVVEESNLNRQFYFSAQVGLPKVTALRENLLRIDKDLDITIHQLKLTGENIPSVYAGCDIIVEAFDRAEMKEMIIETVQTMMPGVPLVIGSGMAGWGNTDALRVRKIDNSLYVCGDEYAEVTDELPVMSPRVCIVSNMQANVVIEILMDKKNQDTNK
jgi:sulfur carrier protein ThiS adenylyltransferase